MDTEKKMFILASEGLKALWTHFQNPWLKFFSKIGFETRFGKIFVEIKNFFCSSQSFKKFNKKQKSFFAPIFEKFFEFFFRNRF